MRAERAAADQAGGSTEPPRRTALGRDALWTLFEQFTRTAWRLETHLVYRIPGERSYLGDFLRGEPRPAEHNAEWHEHLRTWSGQGKTVTRVKCLRRPLTDYQRYELAWGLPPNAEAGEDVRILDLGAHPDVVPPQDYWVFDDRTVVLVNYNAEGAWTSHELVQGVEVDHYLAWRLTVNKYAVPWLEFRS
ncbi:DUF6879 family protein [Crossiella sp. CA198]|uniref:DUF6879 family protein n=1 Tax=Crossiella sp. CA198 TaxID=3455607 RepID=UPI003F8D548C